jgi:hypothetical protein
MINKLEPLQWVADAVASLFVWMTDRLGQIGHAPQVRLPGCHLSARVFAFARADSSEVDESGAVRPEPFGGLMVR